MVAVPQEKDKDDAQHTAFSVLAKVVRRDANWTTEELEDAGFWFKIAVASIFGIIWGAVPIEGMYGMVAAGCATTLLHMCFNRMYLGIDEDEHGGKLALLQDGAIPAIAAFMLAWILSYSQAFTGNTCSVQASGKIPRCPEQDCKVDVPSNLLANYGYGQALVVLKAKAYTL